MKNFKKLYAILLCILLMLCLSLTVFASDASGKTEEEIEWIVSEDQNTLTDGNKVYTRYKIFLYDWFRPYDFYVYPQDIETDNPSADSIGHPANVIEGKVIVNEEIAIVYNYFSNTADYRIYVTEQGKKIMDAYQAGEYSQYELAEGRYFSAKIEQGPVNSWINQTPDTVMEAAELAELAYYEVLGYDATLTFAHVIGAVFENNGEYLYVNYSSLENNHFDADGNLSFRSGTVPIVRLSATDAEYIETALESAEQFSVNTITEEIEPLDATISLSIFLILISPVLYLLPLVLMILGIVMLCIKRIPGRKRWIWVIVLAAAWLVLAVLAGVALILPTFFI